MSGSATSEHRLSLVKNLRIGDRSVQENLSGKKGPDLGERNGSAITAAH